MPYNDRFWQDRPQFPEQRQHGGFLFQCPRVRGDAAGVQSAFITYTDGMPVVIPAMRARFLYRSATVNLTIACEVKMVTDVLEAAVMDMVVAAGFEIQVPSFGGGGTMDDDKGNFTHTGRLNTTLDT